MRVLIEISGHELIDGSLEPLDSGIQISHEDLDELTFVCGGRTFVCDPEDLIEALAALGVTDLEDIDG